MKSRSLIVSYMKVLVDLLAPFSGLFCIPKGTTFRKVVSVGDIEAGEA